MRLILYCFALVLALAACSVEGRAQTPAPSSCPTVSIKCPTDSWSIGDPINVSVEVAGGGGLDLKYRWEVSAGTIAAGQGTTEITIDTSRTGGQSITSTVEVDGLPAGCDRTESCTLMIICDSPPSRMFDEYEDLSSAQEDERLANFATQLRQEPGAQAYIFYFGPRDVDERLGRARESLTRKFGIEPERITGVNAGHSEKFAVELWVRSTGAPEPKPSGN